MITKGTEPASPIQDTEFDGLTKREYFAAQALKGLLSTKHPDFEYNSAEVSRVAVEHADSLIKALNGEFKNGA